MAQVIVSYARIDEASVAAPAARGRSAWWVPVFAAGREFDRQIAYPAESLRPAGLPA